MHKITNLLYILFAVLVVFSCKKTNDEVSDLEKLRNSNNKKSYPAVQMDSLQVINSITQQKAQEVLDLSGLYLSGNKNTDIDSFICFLSPWELVISK